MDTFHEANILFIDENYAAAVEKYNSAATSLSDFAPLHACRGAAHLKLKLFTEALEDANMALGVDPSHEPSCFRKGVALFELEEYESSKQSFQRSVELCGQQGKKDVSSQNRWIRKCETEIEEEAEEEARIAATTKKVEATKVPAPSPPVLPQTVLPSIRYQYYQSATTMNISVMAKNLAPEDVTVVFTPTHLVVRVKQEGQEVTVFDKDLYAEIVPANCKFDIRKPKVEVILVKAAADGNWPTIEGSGKRVAPAASTATASTDLEKAKPYASSRDWNKIDAEMTKELDDDKPQGEEALQVLFKDIYSKADEDTRRAMNKSFQTSGGTVLSTNWGEVKEKKYEEDKQAPKGMEWRSWEGDKVKGQQVEEDSDNNSK